MKKHSETQRKRSRIADLLASGEIPWYRDKLSALRPLVERQKEFEHLLDFFAKKGCSHASLRRALQMAQTMKDRAWNEPSRLSAPRAEKVRATALKMKRLASEIRQREENGFMSILNQEETKRLREQTGWGPEEIEDLSLALPHLALPKWLERRAGMYEEWLRLAARKIPPKGPGLSRIGHICPALYVKFATNRTYYPQVANLLECAGLGSIHPIQLSREVKEFEENYLYSRLQLMMQFRLMDRKPPLRIVEVPEELRSDRNNKGKSNVRKR